MKERLNEFFNVVFDKIKTATNPLYIFAYLIIALLSLWLLGCNNSISINKGAGSINTAQDANASSNSTSTIFDFWKK